MIVPFRRILNDYRSPAGLKNASCASLRAAVRAGLHIAMHIAGAACRCAGIYECQPVRACRKGPHGWMDDRKLMLRK